jgi:hypothetical protein
LHHFSKLKINKEVIKQQESRFFLLILLDDRRIRIKVGPKTHGSYGSGSATLLKTLPNLYILGDSACLGTGTGVPGYCACHHLTYPGKLPQKFRIKV